MRPDLFISRLSHTMRVSTAPRSNPLRVSSTMKQYLPVSWLISSKYFWSSRFSYHNDYNSKSGTTAFEDEHWKKKTNMYQFDNKKRSIGKTINVRSVGN